MSRNKKFLIGCIEGDYIVTEIDDFIAEWHEMTPDISLHEYLGFTQDEWDLWVMDDSVLHQIIIARKKCISITDQLNSIQNYALAARSNSPLEAKQVLEWLKEHRHV